MVQQQKRNKWETLASSEIVGMKKQKEQDSMMF